MKVYFLNRKKTGGHWMKKLLSFFLMVILVPLTLAHCSSDKSLQLEASKQNESLIQIVSTVFPTYDFAKWIAGSKANCSLLINPGSDVHSYSPSPEDVSTIQNADLFIYIGNKDDEWVYTVIGSMDLQARKIIKITDYVTPIVQETTISEGDKTKTDEHMISFPTNAIKLIDVVAQNLGEIDPDNATFYKKNADAYKVSILKVDKKIQQIIAKHASQLLVLGDYFPLRYFVDQYQLAYRTADCEKKSGEKGTGQGTLAGLMNIIRDNRTQYVLYVTLSNPNIIKEVNENTDAEMICLSSCHNFTKEDFVSGTTYLSIMEQNVSILQKALR